MPGKGWSTLLRLYSPLEPFFTKEWQRMNLEGIASKRRQSAYRSGPTRDWLKIKTASWRAANRDRWEYLRNNVIGHLDVCARSAIMSGAG